MKLITKEKSNKELMNVKNKDDLKNALFHSRRIQ